jgi:ABC-type nitrate/sulfonate/bicarbonate transport system permease component
LSAAEKAKYSKPDFCNPARAACRLASKRKSFAQRSGLCGFLIAAAGDLMLNGTLLRHVGASIERVLVGFALAAVVGLTLGVVLGWFRILSDFIKPLVEALRPIPPIAWTRLAILWFGVGNAPSYFLVFIGDREPAGSSCGL